MRWRGFTLVETLVALVLLSMGLLGAASLLLASLQGHEDALRQLRATGLVREMAERIRANPQAGDLYDTRHALPVTACDLAGPCTPEQLAAADLAHFAAAARVLLPGTDSEFRIQFEPAIGPAAPDRYAISLRWRGPHDADGIRNVVALNLLAPPVAG